MCIVLRTSVYTYPASNALAACRLLFFCQEQEFEVKKNRQIYWDDVAMFCHFREYELGIYPMQEGDLIEIDDFSELCELDPSYCGYEAQGQKKSEEK